MSDYIKAKDALEALYRELVSATEERDALIKVVRRVGMESTSDDALLACANITRITNGAIKAWEANREKGGA